MWKTKLHRTAAKRAITSLFLTYIFIQPAAASHGSLDCDPPPSLDPLFEFIHTIGELAFIAGIGIASIGILVAAIMFMVPGEDYSRRGRKVLKGTLIGAVILLSSNAILGFMTNQLGGSMC